MANNFKNAIVASVGTTPTTLYTSTGVKSILIQLDIANIVSSGILVDVSIVDSSASVTGYIVKSAPVPVGGSLTVINDSRKVVLEAGDSVVVKSSAASSASVISSLIMGVA